MNYIYILLIAEILVFLLSYSLTEQDILSPACTMCIMFILSTAFAVLYVDKWGIIFRFDSFLILTSGLFLFCAVTVVLKQIFLKCESDDITTCDYNCSNDKPQFILISLFVIFDLLVCAWYYVTLTQYVGTDTLGFSELAARYREIRTLELAEGVTGDAAGGLLNQFLKVVKASGYVASFLIISFSVRKSGLPKIRTIGLIVTTVLSLVPSFLNASRGEVIKLICFMFIVYYIIWQQKYDWKRDFSRKMVRIGLVALVIGIPIFYYAASWMGRSTQIEMMDYVPLYLGASIQLFNLYVGKPVLAKGFGEESLVGLSKLASILGFGNMSTSMNLEQRDLGFYSSNVYTFFRRPLHDFGLLGMYVFTIMVALLFSYIYYGKIRNRKKSSFTDRWVLVYGYLYYWLILSSIDQYSQSYLSVGAVTIIIILLVEYELFTKFRFSWD